MCLPYLFKSMSDTEIAFVFDKHRGLIETRVPRTDGGASVTVRGVLSASVLQGSGSGGGGGGSFPLDPVPTVGSVLIADADGNPTTSTDLAVTVTNSYGLTIASTTGYNKGINITSTTGPNYGLNIIKTGYGTNYGLNIISTNGSYNYGIDIASTDGINHGIEITTNDGNNKGINIISTSGYNYGINIDSLKGPNYGLTISKTGAGTNQGINITHIADGVNQGINITSTEAYNLGLDITSTSGPNRGIDITSTEGNNEGILITSTTGTNGGLTISKTGAGTNYGITISASHGATNNGLTITGGSGGVTVDGVNIVPLAINAHYPLVQTAHTTVTRTLALADAQDIVPLSAASNAIAVTIPHTLFGIGGTGRTFECRLRAMSVAGGAITFVGSGGIVITYHGKNPGTTPIVAGDFIRVVVTSATSADVWVDAVAV